MFAGVEANAEGDVDVGGVEVDAHADAQAGIGAEANAHADIKNGELDIGADAGASIGVGGDVGVDVKIDPGQIAHEIFDGIRHLW